MRNPYFAEMTDEQLRNRALALDDFLVDYQGLAATGQHPDYWLEDLTETYDYDPTESWSVVTDIEAELKAREDETE